MKSRFLVFVAMLLGLSACSGLKTSSDYDQDFDFTRLNGWNWKHAEQPQTGNKLIDSDLQDRRIRSSISTVLKEKSMTTVNASPDFLVSYEVSLETRQRTSTMSVGIGVGRWGSSGGVSVGGSAPVASTSTPYQVGTLLIDVLNPANGDLLWRGSGQATLDDGATPEEQNANMLEAVRKIMENFPPASSSKAGS